MIRTVISIEPEEKRWLDHQAYEKNTTMTEIVRQAIRFYHLQIEQQQKGDILNILDHTKGIWQHGDGLQYQQKLRGEWNND
jgi:hypothetical protein